MLNLPAFISKLVAFDLNTRVRILSHSKLHFSLYVADVRFVTRRRQVFETSHQLIVVWSGCIILLLKTLSSLWHTWRSQRMNSNYKPCICSQVKQKCQVGESIVRDLWDLVLTKSPIQSKNRFIRQVTKTAFRPLILECKIPSYQFYGTLECLKKRIGNWKQCICSQNI